MDNKQESWKDIFSVPAIVAIIGAVILLAGTFMEVGRFSLFGLNYPFDLHDLSLDRQVMITRILCLLAIAVIVIPKIPKVGYSVCGAVFFALFVPKAMRALNEYKKAKNLLQASGLDSFFKPEDYFKLSAGYYMLIIGTLIMIGMTAYYLIRFFVPNDNSQ